MRRRALWNFGTFHAAIIVGEGKCEWPDGFRGTGQAAVDGFERRNRLKPRRGGVCCDEHAKTL
ncbi:MAG: hypothetical protein EA424_12830 [Planctomycetaceae bacterium]|nr:MAG: hypothetical protein EA424_12830 [Planctomycetaceae bacterium]